MTEATNTKTPELGQQTADGVYAGLTADGKQQIYAMPEDLKTRFLMVLKRRLTLTFNDAAACVEGLNAKKAFGHDDWQIPSLAVLQVLQVYQNEGKLKGTFKTASSSGSDFPDWYWSSTEDRGDSSFVHDVRFSDGFEHWFPKDSTRLSCRPVRLIAAPGS